MGAEGSGDQTTSPADAIAWIIIFSHGTLMLISVALLIYEIKNAPSYQRAVRHAEQRKRETGKYSKRKSEHRVMEHCSYRHSDFYDLIPL